MIEEGEYYFRFVPNGSSPEILSISLDGYSIEFSEDFRLENTLHGNEEFLNIIYMGIYLGNDQNYF